MTALTTDVYPADPCQDENGPPVTCSSPAPEYMPPSAPATYIEITTATHQVLTPSTEVAWTPGGQLASTGGNYGEVAGISIAAVGLGVVMILAGRRTVRRNREH